jgi:ABC-type transporter Mla maintaining outer membrane lipid asymmetry ATPase subunit MlaF
MAEVTTEETLVSNGGAGREGEVLLRCRGLEIEHDGEPLVDGLDLELRAGERVVLVVHSEWGARLIPRCFVGTARPRKGDVELLDHQLDGLSETDLLTLRRGVGYVFHNSGLIHNLTIWYNVALPALYHNRFEDADWIRNRVEALLDRCLLTGVRNARPGVLDDYSRKRAALARSWILSPPLVLLEDPLVEIDSSSASRLLDMAIGPTPDPWQGRDPRPRSPAVLITSQGLHEAFFRFADRLVIIEEGRVIFSDDPRRFDRRGKAHFSDLVDDEEKAQ